MDKIISKSLELIGENTNIETVLSISSFASHSDEDYLDISESLQNEIICEDYRRKYPNSIFQRLSFSETSNFIWDKGNIEAVFKSFEEERTKNSMYLVSILDSAAVIVATKVQNFSKEHLQLFSIICNDMKHRKQHVNLTFIINKIMSKLRPNGKH